MSDEREKLVEEILSRPQQPTLVDSVSLMKFEKIVNVPVLLELDGKLRKAWWERRASRLSWE